MNLITYMRILLSYSTYHFDPQKPTKKQKTGSSAFYIAKSLYEILSKMGSVTYIDGQGFEKVRGQSFDLFVGINRNFCDILGVCKIKKSVLIAVNMHPLERNLRLSRFMLRSCLKKDAVSIGDFTSITDTTMAINKADNIFCFGNSEVMQSYIKYGVPKNKIKSFNYGVGKFEGVLKKQTRKKNQFVYVASEIGLRKGFDIVYDLFSDKTITRGAFGLEIVGQPTNAHYERKLRELVKVLKGKASYRGWIDSSKKEYWKILSAADFLIFPSIEEGQAGTVLDALKVGAVPVLSTACGVDFSPLGNLELKLGSKTNRKILKRAIEMSEDQKLALRGKTKDYYVRFHEMFQHNLHDAFLGVMSGHLYPKISVVLSIFNKEKTILPLIKCLNKSTKSYDNLEAHIIFDGCIDNTEKIVRQYFKDNPFCPVSFERTPNIFEIKTNNIGLKKSTGRYAIIIQDDNFIYDDNFLFEAVNFLDKGERVAILGGLAGVNYYPLETTDLKGRGQILISEDEVYWRQDEKTDPQLKYKIFKVDACMRGPLFIRKSFLERYGYLDEIYAPLHQDDMDLCFRAAHFGFDVYCLLMRVKNTGSSVRSYSLEKARWHTSMIKRNTAIFYSRWKPSKIKDYLWLSRPKVETSRLESKIGGFLAENIVPKMYPLGHWYSQIRK